MKALLQIDFDSEAIARKAASIIQKEDDSRGSVSTRVDKNVLCIEINSKGFASLRARTASCMRDLRVFFDSLSVIVG